MSRMTQFKDKSRKHADDAVSLGLFSYPVLMAADILLYRTNAVPVGEDQIQHLELTRFIAERFNKRFDDIFTLPQPLLNTTTARVMSLTDPAKKMSKSDAPKSYIALTDDADTINAKVKQAVTETEPVFSFEKSGPAVQNLLRMYQAFSGKSPSDIEAECSGQNYSFFKKSLAETIASALAPIQKRYEQLRQDDTALTKILADGAQKATSVAQTTLMQVKQAMGLTV
jgi:tryptophanyl-tRNA synthetase